jgi:hypothetical protein
MASANVKVDLVPSFAVVQRMEETIKGHMNDTHFLSESDYTMGLRDAYDEILAECALIRRALETTGDS